MKELCYIVDKKFLFHVDEEELADKFEGIISKQNFIENQKKEIFQGLKNGINAELYAYEDFAVTEMEACRLILENKYNVPIERKYYCSFKEYLIANQKGIDLISLGYTDRYFSPELREIRLGLEKGLDVSLYAKPEFHYFQMHEIRLGLENNINVSLYAKPEFDSPQMAQIRLGLENNINIGIYFKLVFDWSQMKEIRLGLEKNLDVKWYAKPEFESEQMAQIRQGLESCLDVSWYATPEYDYQQMEQIRLGLEEGLDVSYYANPKITIYRIVKIKNALSKGNIKEVNNILDSIFS